METPSPTTEVADSSIGLGSRLPGQPSSVPTAQWLGVWFVGILSVVAFATIQPWRHSQVVWQTRLGPAQTAAAQQKRPLFVLFDAVWCTPCRKMERETFRESAAGQALADYSAVRLNYDSREGKAAFDRLRIQGLPGYAVLSPEGRVMKRGSGYLSASDLATWLPDANQVAK